MKSQLQCAILLLLLVSITNAGQASEQAATAAARVPDGRTDEIYLRLTSSAAAKVNEVLAFDKGAEASPITGMTALDGLFGKLGTEVVERPYLRPADQELARKVGLDRIIKVRFARPVEVATTKTAFEGSEHVEEAWKPGTFYPLSVSDPLYYYQWGHNNTQQFDTGSGTVGDWDFDANVDDAWNFVPGQGDPNIVIAIVDSGVNPHPDLNLIPGRDLADNDDDAIDDLPSNADAYGHGTAVAGVAAARTNNGLGVAGVSDGNKIMPLKVFRSSDGGGDFNAIANALIHAADNGVRIINMSLGGSGEDPGVDSAIAYAHGLGAIMIAATGNNNKPVIDYPARHDLVIAVGAASPCEERKRTSSDRGQVPIWRDTDPNGVTCDNMVSWGSSYGTSFQGAGDAVDLLAPSMLPTTDLVGQGGYDAGDYVLNFTGTSSAAPFVAGVVALILAKDPTLTNDEVRTLLRNSARDVVNVESDAGWDRYSGYGLVDAREALYQIAGDVDVSGTITDAVTGEAIAGAFIHTFGASTTTDGFGRYVLSVPCGTNVDLFTDRNCYWSRIDNLGITVEDTVFDFTLDPNPPRVSGVVTSQGNPVAGVTVTRSDPTTPTTVITDASGAYEFLVPCAWSGTISAELSGYSFTTLTFSDVEVDHVGQDIEATSLYLAWTGPDPLVVWCSGVEIPFSWELGSEPSSQAIYGREQGSPTWDLIATLPASSRSHHEMVSVEGRKTMEYRIEAVVGGEMLTDELSLVETDYLEVGSSGDFTKLYEAADRSGSGTTIHVEPGTYTDMPPRTHESETYFVGALVPGGVTITKKTKEGTWPSGSVTLDGQGALATVGIWVVPGIGGATIEGIDLTGFDAGVYANDAGVVLQNVNISHCFTAGAVAFPGSDSAVHLVDSSVLHGGVHAIYAQGGSASCQNSTLGWSSVGIGITGGALDVVDSVIKYCEVGIAATDVTSASVASSRLVGDPDENGGLQGRGLLLAGTGQVTMGGNILYDFDTGVDLDATEGMDLVVTRNSIVDVNSAFAVVGDGSGSIIEKNLVAHVGTVAEFTQASDSPAFDCNIWWSHSTEMVGPFTNPTATGGATVVDPQLCKRDPEDGLEVHEDSPCLDANSTCGAIGASGQGCSSSPPPRGPNIGLKAPKTFFVEQNHPNPFNPQTVIRFGLPAEGAVTVRVYDIRGRLVRDLLSQSLPAGVHSLTWEGKDGSGRGVASGVYLYEVVSPYGAQRRSMLLTK